MISRVYTGGVVVNVYADGRDRGLYSAKTEKSVTSSDNLDGYDFGWGIKHKNGFQEGQDKN